MIIFMGVAGSGKSLQGRKLADKLGLPWLSTGEFLRMLISGEERMDMVAGKLLDDDEIIGLVQKIFTIINVNEEFVLDGFPRTFGQADWLLNQVKYGQYKISAVIHIKVSEKAVHERLLKRGRQDDNKESIQNRLEEFEDSIKPILEQFSNAGIAIHDIDGEQEPLSIHQDILKTLDKT